MRDCVLCVCDTCSRALAVARHRVRLRLVISSLQSDASALRALAAAVAAPERAAAAAISAQAGRSLRTASGVVFASRGAATRRQRRAASPRSKCSFVFCGHQRCDAAAAVAARRKAWRRARGQRAAATRCRFTRRGRTHLHQMTQGGARGGPRRARALLRRRADALRQGSVFRSQRSAQRRRLRAAATRVHPLQRHAPRGVRRGGGGAETAVANPWRPQRDAARGSSARACTRARPPLAAGLRRGARGIVWAGRAVLAQLTACLSPPGFGTRGLVTQAGSTRARPRAGWVGSGRTRALRARVESGHAREGE